MVFIVLLLGTVSRSIRVVLDTDFVAGVLADQNPVAGLHLLDGMLRRCPPSNPLDFLVIS